MSTPQAQKTLHDGTESSVLMRRRTGPARAAVLTAENVSSQILAFYVQKMT